MDNIAYLPNVGTLLLGKVEAGEDFPTAVKRKRIRGKGVLGDGTARDMLMVMAEQKDGVKA